MSEFNTRIADISQRNEPPGKPTKKASLADVARRAGVSTATVSRVINNPEKVAEKSRVQVNAAIDALGYIPDGAARALASRQSGIVGAVVPTLDNALFASGIQSFQLRLRQLGYTLIVASHEYDLNEELNGARMLLRQGVDALLLVGSEHDPGLEKILEEQEVPFVNCWAFDPDSPQPHIGFDNRKAARNMAEYLISLGHERFAVIVGTTESNDRAKERLRGIREAISSRGLVLEDSQVLERSYSVRQGRDAMRALLQFSPRPTAVLCGNDILAYGAIAECQSAGVGIPGEISITGFDDLDMSSQVNPALTTVRVRSAEMGEKAADFLVGRIRGDTAPRSTEIRCELMVRGTTAEALGAA